MARHYIINATRIACLFVLLVTSPRAFAGGCSQWLPGPIPAAWAGANGPVYAMTEWSLPGQPLMLIVGGDFSRIGGIVANNIAAWDGQYWRAFGDGPGGPVHSMTTHNVALVVGGEDLVQSWNGSQWASLGTPLTIQPFQDHATVRALASFNGQLYAGGDFELISYNDGFYNNWSSCARFDGVEWHGMWDLKGTWVNAMQSFDQDGGGPLPVELYVGAGGSPNLFKTPDGVNITAITGVTGSVHALTAVNALGPTPAGLIVGGRFHFTEGIQVACNVRLWTGSSWHAFAYGAGVSDDNVSALRAFGSHFYVGGSFAAANLTATLAHNIARWSGSAWSAVGNAGTGYGVDGDVEEMRVYGGSLYVGGDFETANGAVASNIARWNGSQYFAVKEPRSVLAATAFGSRMALGGTFATNTSGFFGLPSANCSNVVTWDGLSMNSLGRGTNGGVRALVSYNISGPLGSSNLVAGGDFTVAYGDAFGSASPVAANRVAVWSESATFPSAWQPMGAGFNNAVHALARFGGNTVAGGAFTASGAATVFRLAKYAGSPASWQPLTSPDPGFNGTVRALKSFSDSGGGLNSYLIVGGDFTGTIGAAAANRIVMRKESPVFGESAWQALGQGFNGPVYAIERHGSGFSPYTYAAGTFTASGTILNLNRVARLNGANWEKVGVGGVNGGFNGPVYALKSTGTHLYAAGAFTSVDGIPANRIARWNGTVWEAVDGGADNTVHALAGFGSEVIAGGAFENVGAPAQVSAGVARWLPTGAPWVARQPASRSVNCIDAADFIVQEASGYGAVTYQWRKDTVPLVNGTTSHGSTIIGAQTSRLVIDKARPQDAGAYTCVISNACGSVTSTPATLTVSANCCPADIAPTGALDQTVNVSDLLAVISAWGSCALPCPPKCAADIAPINAGDCAVNVSDLLMVISRWGPCP